MIAQTPFKDIADVCEYALKCASKGMLVYPFFGIIDDQCTCGHEHPVKANGSHPCGGFSMRDATTDPATIKGWFKKWPNMNFGIATGAEQAESGKKVVVVEMAGAHAEQKRMLMALKEVIGSEPHVVAQVITAEDKRQVYVTVAVDVKLKSNFYPGTKVLDQGEWTMGPGSLHWTGKRYDWADDGMPTENASVSPNSESGGGVAPENNLVCCVAKSAPPAKGDQSDVTSPATTEVEAATVDVGHIDSDKTQEIEPVQVDRFIGAKLATEARMKLIRAMAQSYSECGWKLCRITKGLKAPTYEGWPDNPVASDAVGDSGLGLLHSHSGTCAIDFDDLASAQGWLDARDIDLNDLLHADDAVQIKSGRDNRAKLLYRLPPGTHPLTTAKVKNANGSMMIEFRCASHDGKGIQDVLPPTIHPDTGKPYEWAGAGDYQNLPVLPSSLHAVWTAVGAQGGAPTPVTAAPSGVIAEGGRNDRLYRIAGDLARIGLSSDAIRKALQEENSQRCSPPLSHAEVERIAKSASTTSQGAKDAAFLDGAEINLSKLLEDAKRSEPDCAPLPPSWTKTDESLPAVMASIAAWSAKKARTCQPAFDLCTALAACSGALARTFTGAGGAHTNLYCIAIGPTASGKENALQTVEQVVDAYEAERLAGAPASDTGMLRAIVRNPASVFIMDEVGEVFKSIFADKAASHKAMIGTTFMELYTKGGKVYRGREYSDRVNTSDRVDVFSPCPSLFGATTATTFYEGMTSSAVSSGFLPRLLVFRAPDTIPMPNLNWEYSPLPDDVVQWLDAIRERVEAHAAAKRATGDLSGVTTAKYYPIDVPFTDEAKLLFNAELVKAVNQRNGDIDELESQMLSRLVENAGRVSLTLALADDPQATTVSAKWFKAAMVIVQHATAAFIADIRANMHDSKQAKLEVKVLAYIKQYFVDKKKAVTEGILSDRCKSYGAATPQERKGAIEALVAQARITKTDGRNAGSLRYLPNFAQQ